MGRDVTVGMTGTAVGIVKRQAQQPTRPTWLDWMYVGAKTDAEAHCSSRKRSSPHRRDTSGSGGQNLVEDDGGLLVVGVLGQCQFTDQDLPGLRKHPLLACRQATLLITAPQVADDLGHLVHIARRQLLEVRLIAARPVGRLLGMRGAEYLKDLVKPLLANHVA